MTGGIRRHIPNAITLVRAGLAVVCFTLLALYTRGVSPAWQLDAANAIFVVAAASDFVDGYLARRWDAQSVFGRIVDPLVDKLLVLGVFAYLAGPQFSDAAGRSLTGITPGVVVILMAREFLVTALRGTLESRGKNFAAAWSGKLKMTMQCAAVVCGIAYANHAWRLDEPSREAARVVRDILVWTTVALTVFSGALYLRRATAVG